MTRQKKKQSIGDKLFRKFSRKNRRAKKTGTGESGGPIGRAWSFFRKRFWRICFWSALVFILASGGYALYVSDEVTAKFEGRRWRIPSQIYSAPLTLLPGQSLQAAGLLPRLSRLNYQLTESKILKPGEYRKTAAAIDIHLRDFAYPHENRSGYWLQVRLDGNRIASLTNVTERREVYSAEIEPELIAQLFGAEREQRELVPIDELPPTLINAVLAIEDKYFYLHKGVNPVSTVRAVLKNAIMLGGAPGGSTITQQLVKNFYLSPERTVTRKLKEMVRASVLEMIYTKDEILETYLNEIYFGQSGSVAICGVGQASRFFFQKNVRSLDLAESAMLAGLIRSPYLYNPRRALERATSRRDLILARMLEQNLINQQQHDRAAKLEVRITQHHPQKTIAPYFVDFLKKQLEQTYSREILISEGLRIFTTLDTALQELAEQALQNGIADLEKSRPNLTQDPKNPLQAAIVVLQPQTGHILAMMGGRSYQQTQFNRVTQAHRQPGSVFKPFVFLAGFSRAQEDPEFGFSPVEQITDEPVVWPLDRKRTWSPDNYQKTEYGTVTLRSALEKSINRLAVKLTRRIGLERVIQTARATGIESKLPPYPSVVLGAAEVTPLEVAAAYGALAAQGAVAVPFSILDVVDAQDEVLERKTMKVRQGVSPQAAYLTAYLMQGVLDRGTAASARSLGFSHLAAGKTGTTDNYQDAWFGGFTPSLLAVVWVGHDRVKPTGLSGATGALPIWTEFMKKALAGQPDEPFPIPPDIELARIDRLTGKLAVYGCEDVIDEAFLEGTAPTEECEIHKDPIIEHFKSKFR